jgi:hypothetical protein
MTSSQKTCLAVTCTAVAILASPADARSWHHPRHHGYVHYYYYGYAGPRGHGYYFPNAYGSYGPYTPNLPSPPGGGISSDFQSGGYR